MSIVRGSITLIVALFFADSIAALPARAFPLRAGGPSVQFFERGIRATGATAGSLVHYASVSVYGEGGVLHVRKSAGVGIAAADGTVEFSTDVDPRSIWLVIDSVAGYTVAAPHGMLIREMDFPGNAEENAAGHVAHVQLNRFHVELFVIRPGEGAWTAYYRDGGSLDADHHANGSTHANLAHLLPIGGTTTTTDRIQRGDYIFVVDRNSLEFHVTRRGAK